jgi:DNA-binding SARP family transcriptional activator
VVTDGGDPVTIRRARCRAVLAYLVSRHPDPVVAETLADALWHDATDDARALNSARVHVHHLRQALPGRGRVLPNGDPGYRLLIPRDALDVARFADAAARARDLDGAGQPREALDHFQRALAEWRGEAYADFGGLHPFEAERVKLTEERVDVALGYARLLLDHDGADEAVRILLPFLDTQQAREDVVACLMLAYFRCDRQRDALDLFGRVRADLAETGLQPGPALVHLAEAIVVEPEALAAHRTVIPVRGTRSARRDTVVGREDERARLETAWVAATTGTPQLVYVHGVAGIGKSAIVRRFVAEHPDADVAIGNCEPDARGAYQPFPGLLRSVLASGELATTPPDVIAGLAHLGPDLDWTLPDPAPSIDPGAGRQRLFDAVATVLTAAHRPRVVVIEDLHWASTDTVALLRHVLRETRGQLVLVGTYRDHEDGSPFARALESPTARVARPDVDVEVGPMLDHEVAVLVDLHAPAHHRVSWQADRSQLVELIAGHPLSAVGILQQLELEPDTPIADIVPRGTDGLVRRLLAATTETTRAVLRAAAIVGREFSLALTAVVADLDADTTLRGIEQAMDVGLVVEGDTFDEFSFRHPLYRTAVQRSMSNARQLRLHQRAGEEYERLVAVGDPSARWSDVARHLVTAQPVGDPARASRAAQRAGARAAGRFAHDEAVAWYEQALRLAPDDAELRVSLELELGRELDLGGSTEAARRHYFSVLDQALALEDEQLLVDALTLATPRIGVLDPGFGARLEHYVTEALARVEPGSELRIPLLRCAGTAAVYLDPPALDGYVNELAALAEAYPSPEHRRTLLALEYMRAEGHSPEPCLDLARAICSYSTGPGLVVLRGIDDRRLLHELLRCGLTSDFDRHLEDMRRRAEASAIPLHRHWVASLGATRRLMRETGPEVEAAIDLAALIGRRAGIRDADGLHLLQVFVLRYQQGRAAEVTRDLTAPRDDAPPIVAGITLLGLSFAAAGKLDDARAILDRLVGDGLDLPRNNFYFGALALLGGAAAVCGDDDQRGLLYDALVPIADQFVVFGTGGAVLGTGHHWLGRLALARGDSVTARDHLERAIALCYRSDAPFWEQRGRDDLDRAAG